VTRAFSIPDRWVTWAQVGRCAQVAASKARLAAEPGGKLGVGAGVGGDIDDRAEGDVVVAADLAGSTRLAPARAKKASSGRLRRAGRWPEPGPSVGEDLLDVTGDGEPAGDLAPRDLDQGVELGVVGPGRAARWAAAR